jgi:polar amino acid transport system substrate-binding protein
MTQLTPAVRADLAPTGKVRAGINYGNFILAARDPSSGESRGVAIEIAEDLGRRLSVPVELVAYDSVAAMVDAARTGAWDIAFLGVDPAREDEISFTAAYLEIEATYLVSPGSALRTVADVDQKGVRVAAPARANYELFLGRTLKQGELVRAQGAGLREALTGYAERLPGARALDGRFMAVQQAVGVPKGRDTGLAYLRGVVEDVKASGLVGRAIARTAARGVTVAPRVT